MERYWKAALGVAGIGAIGFFVFWSLYKQWLSLPMFPQLSQQQAFELLRYFLFLTFGALVLAIVAYLFTLRSAGARDDYIPVRSEQLLLPNGTRFTDEQFATYKAVWLALNRLRRAGDALLQAASADNLTTYAVALRETVDFVNANGIFFHPADYKQLQQLLQIFSYYHVGKARLIDMRVVRGPGTYSLEDIKRQIKSNERNTLRYSELLERIRTTYHDRLSWAKMA